MMFRIFGEKLWAARIPVSIDLAAMTAVVFWLVDRLSNRMAAALAALCFLAFRGRRCFARGCGSSLGFERSRRHRGSPDRFPSRSPVPARRVPDRRPGGTRGLDHSARGHRRNRHLRRGSKTIRHELGRGGVGNFSRLPDLACRTRRVNTPQSTESCGRCLTTSALGIEPPMAL